MVVNEEQNKHYQQARILSRFERERLNLSVSVVETLSDSSASGLSWLDEELGDEANQSTGFQRYAQGKSCFPPRLSLQSRPMAAVHSSKEIEGWKATTSLQQESVLLRFAQRLTASFAAMGSLEVNTSSDRIQQKSTPYVIKPCDASFLPSEPQMDRVESVEQEDADQITAKRKSLPPIPSPASLTSRPVKRQRLGGWAGRIRLETAPMTSSSPSEDWNAGRLPLEQNRRSSGLEMDHLAATMMTHYPDTQTCTHEMSVTSAHAPAMGSLRSEMSATSTHLPIIDLLRKYEQGMSSSLPVAGIVHAALSAQMQPMQAGSGEFDAGQGDTRISNEHITPSSVVLVTLTANPGPVVVQYISLQPQIGFTIHLTAPTAMKTPFNYIVLPAELA